MCVRIECTIGNRNHRDGKILINSLVHGKTRVAQLKYKLRIREFCRQIHPSAHLGTSKVPAKVSSLVQLLYCAVRILGKKLMSKAFSVGVARNCFLRRSILYRKMCYQMGL